MHGFVRNMNPNVMGRASRRKEASVKASLSDTMVDILLDL